MKLTKGSIILVIAAMMIVHAPLKASAQSADDTTQQDDEEARRQEEARQQDEARARESERLRQEQIAAEQRRQDAERAGRNGGVQHQTDPERERLDAEAQNRRDRQRRDDEEHARRNDEDRRRHYDEDRRRREEDDRIRRDEEARRRRWEPSYPQPTYPSYPQPTYPRPPSYPSQPSYPSRPHAPAVCADSPFPRGNVAVDARRLAGKVFSSPRGNGKSLVFRQVDNEILVTEFKNGAVVLPYENLNCGTIDRIAAASQRPLSCTRGQTEISIATYKSPSDRTLNIVRPAFDSELQSYRDSCTPIYFNDWAERAVPRR